MGIYQFNIRDKHGIILDEDGVELPDILSVAQEAIQSAQEFVAEAQVPTAMAFEITDEHGRVVLSMPISSHALPVEEERLALAS